MDLELRFKQDLEILFLNHSVLTLFRDQTPLFLENKDEFPL